MSETKLFILRPCKGKLTSDPWEPWYDKAFGFVVRATNVQEARAFAANEAGDEGKKAWRDPYYTTCELLSNEGDPGVVMIDFHAA